MREFNADKEPIGIHKKQKKELTYLGSIRPKKGHKLFMLKNGVVSEVGEAAYMNSDTIELTQYSEHLKHRFKRKVATEKGATYISALNLKNAIKKFLKKGFHVNRGNIDWETIRANYTSLTNYQSEEEVYFSIDEDLMKIFEKYGIKHPAH